MASISEERFALKKAKKHNQSLKYTIAFLAEWNI